MVKLPILSSGSTILDAPQSGMRPDPRGAELSAYTPTLAEKAAYWLAENWFGDSREGVGKAERLVNVGRSTIVGNIPFAAYDAGRSVASGRYGEAALNAAAVAAPLAGGFRAAQIARNTGLREAGRTAPRAVIRRDDVFRGHGVPTTGIKTATKPYAIRVTGLDQLDDMVKSGLVRPKPGGYGKQSVPTIYFGEAADTGGSTLSSKIGANQVRLVANSETVANRKGPIPIDELKHIYAIRNGKEVDILDEVIRRNQKSPAK